MTKRLIKEARAWEQAWIKAGRPRPRKGKKVIVSESMQIERPHVSPIQRFHESYSGKTPKTTTAFQCFNAALDAANGKARWPR